MSKWMVHATVESSLYIGDVEADTMKDAMKLGRELCKKHHRFHSSDLEQSSIIGLEEVVEEKP